MKRWRTGSILTPLIALLVVAGCMTRNLDELPQPATDNSGTGTTGGFDNAGGNTQSPYGDMDQVSYTQGQQLVGTWNGAGDDAPPNSRWAIRSRATQGSNTQIYPIAVSLRQPVDLKNESYRFLLSTPRDVETLALCEGDCSAPGVRRFPADYVFFTGDRKFFLMQAAALVEDGLILEFEAQDKQGSVKGRRGVEFVLKSRLTPTPTPTTVPNPTNPNTISATEAQSLMRQYCGGAGCHDNYVNNPSLMSKTRALSDVNSGRMPIGRSLIGADRDRFIQWLQQP